MLPCEESTRRKATSGLRKLRMTGWRCSTVLQGKKIEMYQELHAYPLYCFWTTVAWTEEPSTLECDARGRDQRTVLAWNGVLQHGPRTPLPLECVTRTKDQWTASARIWCFNTRLVELVLHKKRHYIRRVIIHQPSPRRVPFFSLTTHTFLTPYCSLTSTTNNIHNQCDRKTGEFLATFHRSINGQYSDSCNCCPPSFASTL